MPIDIVLDLNLGAGAPWRRLRFLDMKHETRIPTFGNPVIHRELEGIIFLPRDNVATTLSGQGEHPVLHFPLRGNAFLFIVSEVLSRFPIKQQSPTGLFFGSGQFVGLMMIGSKRKGQQQEGKSFHKGNNRKSILPFQASRRPLSLHLL